MPEAALPLTCGQIQQHGVPAEIERARGAFVLARGDEVTLDMFAEPIDPLPKLLAERGPNDHLSVVLCWACPNMLYGLGDGWVGGIEVRKSNIAADDGLSCGKWQETRDDVQMKTEVVTSRSGGFVVRDGPRWRVHMRPPDEVLGDTRLLETRAEAWISHKRRWAWIDVQLELDVRRPTLVLELPALESLGRPGYNVLSAGFRLTKLDVNGKPQTGAAVDKIYRSARHPRHHGTDSCAHAIRRRTLVPRWRDAGS
jgi:hypothetical protein